MLPRLALPLAAAFALIAPAAASADELVVPLPGAHAVQLVDASAQAKLGDPIPVGGQEPTRAAVSPDGTTAWVTTQDPGGEAAGHLMRIDLATRAVTPIAVGVQPGGVAVSPDGARVYVADFRSQDVSVVDTATNTVIASPGGVGQVDSVAVSPDGRRVYVSDSSSNAVHVLDAATNAFTGTIGVDGNARRLQVSPDGARLYVTVQSEGVEVIDTATGTVGATVAGEPAALTLAADGRRLYETEYVATGALRAIGTDPLALSGAPFPRDVAAWATSLAVSADGARVYVLSTGDNNVPGELRVVGTGTGETVGTPLAFPTTNLDVEAALVPDQAPVAAFTAGTATPGEPAAFDATGSSDPDGTVARYDWDFGDGTTLADGGPRPAHVYARPGTYTATLTVTDAAGTSTAQVFTGQTALRQGGPRARATRAVTVAAPVAATPTPSPAPGPTSAPTPGAGPDRTAPALTALSLGRARVAYRLSERATVAWTVERRAGGHWMRARGGMRTSPAGRSAFALRRLAPGRYRLVARARDAAGNRSRTVTARLRVRG